MGKNRKLVFLFYFNEMIAGKDMFLVPKYLADILGYTSEIVFPITDNNKQFSNFYRGVKLTPIKSASNYYSTCWSEKEMLYWLIKNARRINVLLLFWCNKRNIIFANVYKILNPKGICYVKGDFDENRMISSSFSSKMNFKKYLKNRLYGAIDIISAETWNAYRYIKNGAYGPHLAERIEYVPNGFDIDLCNEFDIQRLGFSEKENLMITVGRIGTFQKNNEMLLEALNGIDMKEWKLLLIGPVEKDFHTKFSHFIIKNPDKKDKVIFLGLVNNRKRLWEIYNKAKVFILTSRWEGFPNVYAEALFWGNYIITTPVSSAMDVTERGNLGKIIPYEKSEELQRTILEIVNGKLALDTYYSKIRHYSKNFIWSEILLSIANRIKYLCEK